MTGESDYSYLEAMKDDLVLYCREYQYKNGAFATAVTETTSIIDDLNIIINSPLLATYERKAFEQVKNAVIRVRNMQVRGEKADFLRIDMETEESTKAIEKVISVDMKLRGQYEPPSMIQIYREDRTVIETILMDKDGEKTYYKGGQLGVIPGAPQAFNEAQQKTREESFGPKENYDGDHDARGMVPSIFPP